VTSTASLVSRADEQVPEPGELVRVRGQQWVVASRRTSRLPQDELASKVPPGRTMVTLTSVSDDDQGDELTVVWEIEPGREVLPATRLPEVTGTSWDVPEVLGAFLDAVRWGTVASADDQTLQAPFRAGITVEDYQLEPVAKALAMPRVALLLADDVGLGKTIEAGLVVQEMLLRNRARRIVVICPAPLTGKWAEEMQTKFGLDFKVLDAEALKELRRSHGLQANPFSVYPRTIVSLQWLRTPRVQRLLDEVLDGRGDGGPSFFDILLVDEAHHCAPPAPGSGKHYAPIERSCTCSHQLPRAGPATARTRRWWRSSRRPIRVKQGGVVLQCLVASMTPSVNSNRSPGCKEMWATVSFRPPTPSGRPGSAWASPAGRPAVADQQRRGVGCAQQAQGAGADLQPGQDPGDEAVVTELVGQGAVDGGGGGYQVQAGAAGVAVGGERHADQQGGAQPVAHPVEHCQVQHVPVQAVVERVPADLVPGLELR